MRHAGSIAFGSGALACAASLTVLSGAAATSAALLALVCIWIAYVDLDRFIIPDSANLAVLAIGMTDTVMAASPGNALPAFANAVLRCLVAGGVLWLTGEAYRRISGRIGLGMGDVKLAAAAGACLDWQALPLALQLAVFLALGAIATMIVAFRKLPERHMALPFGAFLAPAIWLAFLWERYSASL